MDYKKLHQEELGFKIPENYFEQSKSKILEQTQTKKVPLYRNPMFALSVAASILVLIAVTLFMSPPQSSQQWEEDVLITSLVEKGDDVDALIDDYIEEELFESEDF